MTYAIIEIKGKQFKVKPGQKITIDRVNAEVGTTIDLDVLLTKDGDKTTIGTPQVKDAGLVGVVTEHTKGEKIRVATYKSKSRYRRVKGHRQAQTVLEIQAGKASKTTTKAEPKKAAAPKKATKAKSAKKAA